MGGLRKINKLKVIAGKGESADYGHEQCSTMNSKNWGLRF